MPAQTYIVILISRNQMHVEMKYRLACCLLIILHDVVSVASQHVLHLIHHFLCKDDSFRSKLIVNVIQISVMLLRDDQRVSLGRRSKIQYHTEIIILVKCCRRDLTGCDLTKNAIFIFHICSSFPHFILYQYRPFSGKREVFFTPCRNMSL